MMIAAVTKRSRVVALRRHHVSSPLSPAGGWSVAIPIGVRSAARSLVERQEDLADRVVQIDAAAGDIEISFCRRS